MLLIVTNSHDETANFLTTRLPKSSKFLRFNSDDIRETILEYRGLTPKLRYGGKTYLADDFNSVWFRRPKSLNVHPLSDIAETAHVAAEWGAALEGFFAHIPTEKWINHPAFNVQASHKLEQLTRAQNCGLRVPETLVSQSENAVIKFYRRHSGKIIVKPLASGYLERENAKDDTQIYTNRVLEKHLRKLSSVKNCPTFFQQLVKKVLDVRICIVDSQCTAVGMKASECGEQRIDIRRNNMTDVRYLSVTPPKSVINKLMKLVKSYHLRFAAIDMAISKSGEWFFFEINPNGQWAWLDIAAKTNIAADFIHAFSK